MDEVKLAIYGMDGHHILGHLGSLTRVRLTALGGLNQDQTSTTKERFPHVPVFDDLDALLAKSEIDLITFCIKPRTLQTRLVLKALAAGKHVLVEKPMATTMADLEQLRQAVTHSGTQLRTMTPMPYEPNFTGMQRLVRAGTLGTIVQIFAMKSYPYNDGRPQDRREDGGIILQAGIHAVSFIRSVTGLEFVEVFAQDTGAGNPKKGNLQMGANATFRMSNGALAALLCNYCNPKQSLGFHGNDQLRVHGTKGMIELVDGKKRRCLALVDGDAPSQFEDVEPEKRYPQDLIDCILDGTPTLLTQEDTFMNTRVVLRTQESATQGVPLKI